MSRSGLLTDRAARQRHPIVHVVQLRRLLSLERRSLTEIATALSLVAIAGSALYNLGFFAPVEWTLISILNVQDLISGAAMALLPMSIATWLAWQFSKFITEASERPRLTMAIGVPLLLGSGAAAWYFMYGQQPSTIAHLALAYLATGAGAAILNIFLKARLAGVMWLAFSLVYIPFSVGVGDSLRILGSESTGKTEVVTDVATIDGRILRVTSGYAMIFDGAGVAVLPLSKVKSMRRMFDGDPERDYLSNYRR